MLGGINPRVLGSSFIGLALVCGAWVLNSLRTAPTTPPEAAVYLVQENAPVRNALSTEDQNTDGIEDWKEPFLTAAPVILNTSSSSNERTGTLTEQVGINLMESMLMAESFGAAGASNEQLIKNSTEQAFLANRDRIYTSSDITVLTNPELASIRDYANAVALILSTNDVKGSKNELLLFDEAVRTGNQQLFAQITRKADMYKIYRDELLKLPVPLTLTQEHLRLINVFNVMEANIRSMTELDTDPLKTLVRLENYQDDTTELGLALNYFYTGISKFPDLFSPNDPALAFTTFGQLQQQ
ncbi:hypothetical protein K2Q16_00975 [Patescibacteria group bacterium]|nr:hypothetical protein [Patescibacteria group bacterium]